jgi:hypothetical protein
VCRWWWSDRVCRAAWPFGIDRLGLMSPPLRASGDLKPKMAAGSAGDFGFYSLRRPESVALRVYLPTRFAKREPVRCALRGVWALRAKEKSKERVRLHLRIRSRVNYWVLAVLSCQYRVIRKGRATILFQCT